MELFVFLFQSFQYVYRLFNRRFGNVYLLETSHNATTTRKVAIVLIVCRRTDKANITFFQIRFQHIGSIHRTIRDTTCPYQVMDFVDIDNRVSFLLYSVHHAFDAFLEITTVLRTSQHRSQIHLIDTTSLQTRRHISLDYSHDKPINQCGLSHTWFAYMQGIVLVFATKHLNGSFQFRFSSDEWILLFHPVIHTSNHVVFRLLIGRKNRFFTKRIIAIIHQVIITHR